MIDEDADRALRRVLPAWLAGDSTITASSTFARRRPEMITLLPSLWKASASPRPDA